MKIKCPYCGGFFEDTSSECPHCGAVNQNIRRVGNNVPKTIEELKEWYTAHNLPPEEVTRIFIGKNTVEPRAFGIYKLGTDVVVYKNKSDGSRVIRYQGPDEAYGVNELYMKIKELIAEQKARGVRKVPAKKKKKRSVFQTICYVISRPFHWASQLANLILRILYVLFNLLAVTFTAAIIGGGIWLLIIVCYNNYAEIKADTHGAYISEAKDTFYYNFPPDEWYVYDEDAGKWELLDSKPEDVDKRITRDYEIPITYQNKYGIKLEQENIKKSGAYVRKHKVSPSRGYYEIGDNLYYYQRGDWYKYDSNQNGWDEYTDLTDDFRYDYNDYYDYRTDISYYDGEYITSFEDTDDYYAPASSSSSDSSSSDSSYGSSSSYSSSDWDSDSDWDSGSSWDSGSTDWDSDW